MAGRKQRSQVEQIRAKAWITRVMYLSQSKTQYQFEQAWDQRSMELPEEQQRSAPRLDRLKDGLEMSPSAETLVAVERYFPKSRFVYDTGPGAYPLWDVLEGTVEHAGALLRKHVTAFDPLSHQPPLTHYTAAVLRVYFPDALETVNITQWLLGEEDNIIALRLAPEMSPVENPEPDNVSAGFKLDDIAVILAAHRVSLFIGLMPPVSTYCVHGVSRVFYQLLRPWGIGEQTIGYMDKMWNAWQQSPLQS